MTLKYSTALVTLAAINFEPLVNFYRQFFGQEPLTYIPATYAQFQFKGLTLGIFRPNTEHEIEFSQPSYSAMSICIEVEDLELTIAHLTQMGYPPTQKITYVSHGREIYVYDPLGNRLILHQAITIQKN